MQIKTAYFWLQKRFIFWYLLKQDATVAQLKLAESYVISIQWNFITYILLDLSFRSKYPDVTVSRTGKNSAWRMNFCDASSIFFLLPDLDLRQVWNGCKEPQFSEASLNNGICLNDNLIKQETKSVDSLLHKKVLYQEGKWAQILDHLEFLALIDRRRGDIGSVHSSFATQIETN